MNLNQLTPEQIVFLYLRHIRYIEVHDEVYESIKELNKEGVQTSPSLTDLKNNSHVTMVQEINEVLKPIYDLIISTEPEYLEDIKKTVTNPMNLPEDIDLNEDEEDDDEPLF